MFTEEVMRDEHEGATLFPQGGLQKGPVPEQTSWAANIKRRRKLDATRAKKNDDE